MTDPVRTAAADAVKSPDLSDETRPETQNARIQRRYDELRAEGKHGHYETMFRVVHEEIERTVGEAWDTNGKLLEQIAELQSALSRGGEKGEVSDPAIDAIRAALRRDAQQTSEATKIISERKSARNRAAGDTDANYGWFAPEETTAGKALAIIETLLTALSSTLRERDEAVKALGELKALLSSSALYIDCGLCGGDCASANPPVTHCPMQRLRHLTERG